MAQSYIFSYFVFVKLIEARSAYTWMTRLGHIIMMVNVIGSCYSSVSNTCSSSEVINLEEFIISRLKEQDSHSHSHSESCTPKRLGGYASLVRLVVFFYLC